MKRAHEQRSGLTQIFKRIFDALFFSELLFSGSQLVYFLVMKPRTKFWLALGALGLPLAAVWADLILNAILGSGYLKLGYWWF